MSNLREKIIVITGGAGLIGSSFVERVASEGAIAVIADINLDKAVSVKKHLLEKKGNEDYIIETLSVDICDKESILKGIESLNKQFGKIDALVNNAYPRNKNYGRKFEEVSYYDFCENTNLHLGGYFLMCQVFCNYFEKQGFGNIVNISSIYGMITPRFEVYEGTSMTMPVEYAVIKSALIHLTKYIAKYYKGKNIRVNSISLGGILDNQPEEFIEAYKSLSLNKGMLDSSDVSGSLIFLLSDLSRYMNGHNLVIDDGYIL